jgi:hypothetical protein
MRYIQGLVLAAALLPAAVSAQQVAVGGWVNKVDAANSTVTIRTLANPRTIQVAPNAVIRINGTFGRLDQIPANSEVSITTERDPNGVLMATQISARSVGPEPPAAALPGSVVQGTLVGLNVPNNTITLRTSSGDHVYSLGSAPILVNGVRGSLRSFRVGQMVQLQRALPTAASTDYITQAVWVLPTQSRVAGYQATAPRPVSAFKVRSRTLAYRKTYRSKKSTSRQRTRRKTHRTRTRTRRQAMLSGAEAAAVLAGTAPVTAAVVPISVAVTPPTAAGVVTAAPAAVASPGVIYVTPGAADFAVPPVTAVPAVPATGGVVVAAPATTAPSATNQAGTTDVGIPDVRHQSAASSQPAAGVGNPRNQTVAPNAVGVQAVPAAPGVPDPRFQSTSPGIVPGLTVPAVPGTPAPIGRPGFVGPRVLAPRPMVAPAAPR